MGSTTKDLIPNPNPGKEALLLTLTKDLGELNMSTVMAKTLASWGFGALACGFLRV